jgi:RNA polymerase sigma-70 factor, ECF subfamily
MQNLQMLLAMDEAAAAEGDEDRTPPEHLASAAQPHGNPGTTSAAALQNQAYLQQLILKVAGQDAEAFRELYRLTSPRLHALARRLTRRPDLAEDALQEAFVSVWLRAGTYDTTRGEVFPWLVGILRHRVADRHRRRELPLLNLEEAELQSSEAPSPQALAILSIDGARACQAMAALSQTTRQCLELAYFSGASFRDIAEVTGLPLNTVKSVIRRGLAKLRVALTDAALP